MHPRLCEQLDDFLDGVLSGAAAEAFRAHLDTCPACREEVESHRTMSELLQQAFAAPPLPAGLLDRVRASVDQDRRQRRVRWALGLAAAAALLAAVGVWWFTAESTNPATGLAAIMPDKPQAPVATPTSRVRVSFPADPSVIVVPMKSDKPNITIVWVFATNHADPPPEPERNGQ